MRQHPKVNRLYCDFLAGRTHPDLTINGVTTFTDLGLNPNFDMRIPGLLRKYPSHHCSPIEKAADGYSSWPILAL